MILKNQFKYLILIVIGIVVLFIIRFAVLGGDEDEWRCEDGRWIRHGQPSAPRPNSPCQ